ncbi:MAG: [FeFe] hydrogenase H-cluster maturation GTPase HydF [Acutalibacteraceae bacterium]|nr:[FeFe] hydrogenase H-cluster maturation GTPase HydF [Acutalibacteraceae bacterium]
MSLNATPSGERVHIGFFGRRNAGKSSVVNAVTGQNLAIVSDVLGTTTDPVLKAMELLPLGPVVIIDTPGIDDEGELGALRVRRSYQMLNKTDVAVLVVDSAVGLTDEDKKLLEKIRQKRIPYVIAYNKSDKQKTETADEHEISVSAATGEHIHELKELMTRLAKPVVSDKRIVSFMLDKEDIVVLVVPIDGAAPKGRLILPQQQTIRDIIDAHAVCMVTQPEELPQTLNALAKKPKMVITDSQAFGIVNKMVPQDILLTSFSILFAHYKGNLRLAMQGAAALDTLTDGDTILMAEGCTHHRQCDDIGTVKIPRLIRRYTGKDVQFVWTSGTEFPDSLRPYKIVIHCGGCMLGEREMQYRLKCAEDEGIPITNYGIAIAHMNGILSRSTEFLAHI